MKVLIRRHLPPLWQVVDVYPSHSELGITSAFLSSVVSLQNIDIHNMKILDVFFVLQFSAWLVPYAFLYQEIQTCTN